MLFTDIRGEKLGRYLFLVGLSVLCAMIFVSMIARASTTINANIQTDGTLSVTGASTLTGNVGVGTTLSFADPGLATSTLITLAGRQLLNASSSDSVGNLFLGLDAGSRNTSGTLNTAFGYQALELATSSSGNTAIGNGALSELTLSGTAGNDNTVVGGGSALFAASGSQNTALGSGALSGGIVSGNDNIGIGYGTFAGGAVSGTGNIAIGDDAFNGGALGGNYNTTLGYDAGTDLYNTVHNNTFIGAFAGYSASPGAFNNITLGYQAGYSLGAAYSNILLGVHDSQADVITSGHGNVGLGNELYFQSTTANNQLNIGNLLFATLPATTTGFILPTSGAIGVGTSTPWGKLSISLNNTDTNRTAFAIASSTASATTTLFLITNTGHIIASSTNPVLSSCGTNPTMVGDDTHGKVTSGSTNTTGCTVTFAASWTNAPACIVTDENATTSLAYTVSTTAITITDVNIGTSKFDYVCEGVSGTQ